MKTLSILISVALFLPAVRCLAADSAIPPEVEKQFDPDVLSGKRPKTVILMQSMILGLRDHPKLDADIVTIGFSYGALSPTQKAVLENWFRTGTNKVCFELRPSNFYGTVSGRATSPMPADMLTRMFGFKLSWVSDRSLAKHAVNTDCEGLRLGYFHNPRDSSGMKEGEVVALSGFPSEGSEVIAQGTNGMVVGKFMYGKTECFFIGAALGGPARLRWEKNFWQWALGLKVPGPADAGARGGIQVAATPTNKPDETPSKNGEKSTGKAPNETVAIRTPYAEPKPARDENGRLGIEGASNKSAEPNLLQNAGFEEPADNTGSPPHWTTLAARNVKPQLTDQAPHSGQQALVLPAHAALEQTVASAKAGAYVARGWVKSQVEQTVALLVQDTNQPWVGYACAELKVPANQWVQVETFCSLDRDGSLTFNLGELSSEFRLYHGVSAQMRAPITIDDLELFRYEPKPASGPLAIWEVKPGTVDWSKRSQWSQAEASTNFLIGTCAIQSRQLVGIVRTNDGSLEISSIQGDQLKLRCTVVPSIPIPGARCSLITARNRKGLRVSSESGDRAYTAWFTAEGLLTIAAEHIPQFQVKDCHLRYGLLPSFVGTDIVYAPGRMEGGNQFHLPSTQWLVGLVDGNDAMLVTVWESDSQTVSLGLVGKGENRLIDSLTIATAKAGFSLSLVEHNNLWHRETLKEDWLGDYVPIAWERPFPARWMGQFFVTPATKATFREPCMDYSFPIANARTRQYGVWFEDWNRYPFYFDGPRTIVHFEKTFAPNGDALIYFLEPAAADLFSPCEVVEQALGREKAMALFDFDANRLRKLNYSTSDEFMYDRPVCATTDRLAEIRQQEKATIGLNLATHIYEFIRGIRSRVDQYNAFFAQLQDYLASEKKAHPELKGYIEEIEATMADTQTEFKAIYATSLPAIQEKTDAMKKNLLEGTGDGFRFGDLDCRTAAGWQDDLCRRCNRLVLRLTQTAALNCGDSPQKALIAKHIWDQSRATLRQPTRWESRRTLYFFEP